MILRHDRNKEPELNITPLIDVVFLLLIFFMVSTTFEKESEISIELPEAAGEKSEDERFTIEVTIDGEGHYFINEKRTRDEQLSTLKKALRDVRADHEDPRLILSADRNTPHQAVIRAMDAARQIGLVNLTFATKQNEEK
ncbi:ExbD/TolR family protein [Thiohalophilus thiocyanatoxydans]|uniref:Biopolymer transport protein ExbD n=1 Tax=Thiohalophilus thiocyanatoxydans TaxID=381308 RepID=A0A4R8IRH6_9GAMM|nr:biopolymer transporter ExbD [Thiohalophilus thiocyanatoxydans]TDY02944.1 biopolymer transport protein ExbD [Thiohalophilus thiocyanatoxydans]